MADMPGNNPTRTELEDLWLAKLKEAEGRYGEASAKWHDAIHAERQSLLPSSDGNHAIRRAARAETVARLEYARVLSIFMDLVVKGKVPPVE